MSVEERLSQIEARNSRVEADKAWESSLLRRGFIAAVLYSVSGFLLTAINSSWPWLHAAIPALGYVISTLSLPFLRSFWQMRLYKKLLIAFLLFPFALPARADITIAISAPLSGEIATLGEDIRNGAQQAATDINAQGGVLGQKLVLDFEDDGCNATQATSVANKIIAHPPAAVLGPLCSAATLAAAPVYGEIGLPQITLSSNASITDKGHKHLFRMMGRDDNQAPALATHIIKIVPQNAKIAVLDDKGSWGVGFAGKAEETLKSHNRAIALRDSVAAGQKDFSSLITKLKQNGITHVVMGLYHVEAALLVRQAREQKFMGQFYGGDPIQTPEFWKIAGDAADGVQQSGPFNPKDTQAGKKLLTALQASNKPVGVYSFYAYAAIETLASAIKKAGGTKSDVLTKTLHSENFQTLLGTSAFDEKGDLKNFTYRIFQWHKGDYAAIGQ